MKILMLSKALMRGTYQRKLEEIAALPDVEQLTVIVPPYWREKNVGIIKLEKTYTRGYTLIVEPMLLNGSYHLHFYRGLAKWVKQLKPDIFHVDEESFNLATFQGVRLARHYNTASVFYNYANIFRNYPPPFSLFEKYNFDHANGAMACNQEAFDILRQRGFNKVLDIVPQFGVDPETFHRCQPPAAFVQPALFTIGFAGRLLEEKGLKTLLEAASCLQGEWRLVLIGEGNYRTQLEAQAIQLNITNKVQYIGSINSNLIPAYFSGLDVLVLPSLTRSNWKEQYGRVLQEAMACETPVIGSSSGEIPNVIGGAGLIFPEGDATALAGCLQKLMDDTALRQDLAQRGLIRVKENFTQKQIAARHLALYHKALNPNQTS